MMICLVKERIARRGMCKGKGRRNLTESHNCLIQFDTSVVLYSDQSSKDKVSIVPVNNNTSKLNKLAV